MEAGQSSLHSQHLKGGKEKEGRRRTEGRKEGGKGKGGRRKGKGGKEGVQ